MTTEKRYCECGKQIPAPRNTTIWAKQCPSCTYANLYSKNKANVQEKKENGSNQTKRKKSTIDKKLDKAWSKLVKLKAGMKCEKCGKDKNLNSHHVFSRAKKSVRWKTINGICLCVGHHIGVNFSAHKTPLEFNEWYLKYKGEEYVTELRIAATQTAKYSDFEKELILKELNAEIKALTKK